VNQIALFDHPDPELQAWAKEHTAKIRAENQMIYKQMAVELDREVLTKLWAKKLKYKLTGKLNMLLKSERNSA